MFSAVRAALIGPLVALGGCASADLALVPVATQAAPDPAQPVRWGTSILNREPSWFASSQARAIADAVLQYQSPEGGWPKNTDLSVPPRSPADLPPANLSNTIDNNGTTLPMHFLARVIQATGDARYVQAFNRGFDYLIAAQYPNGGWPQFYPLRNGYWSRITFNDDAMVRVMRLLRGAASGGGPYDSWTQNGAPKHRRRCRWPPASSFGPRSCRIIDARHGLRSMTNTRSRQRERGTSSQRRCPAARALASCVSS